jgi:hypothetical protein
VSVAYFFQLVSGMAASINNAAGMEAVVVAGWPEYEHLAITLATDANRRGQLRRQLTMHIREGKVCMCLQVNMQRYASLVG